MEVFLFLQPQLLWVDAVKCLEVDMSGSRKHQPLALAAVFVATLVPRFAAPTTIPLPPAPPQQRQPAIVSVSLSPAV